MEHTLMINLEIPNWRNLFTQAGFTIVEAKYDMRDSEAMIIVKYPDLGTYATALGQLQDADVVIFEM